MQVQPKPWGNSQGIRFSKELLSEAGFSANETLTAEIANGKIVLSRASRLPPFRVTAPGRSVTSQQVPVSHRFGQSGWWHSFAYHMNWLNWQA